jgi:hypothetical protein
MHLRYIASISLTSKKQQMTGEILFIQGLYWRYSPGSKNGRSGSILITQLDHHKRGTHSWYACNLALSFKHMTQRMTLLGTLPTTYPNTSVLLILHRAIAGNYLITLVSREKQNAPSRSLKALMTSLWIPTFGRRRFCRKHIIHSLKCLALRLQLSSQRKVSKNFW